MEMERLLEYGISSILAAPPGARIIEEARRRSLQVFPMVFSGSVSIKAIVQLHRLYSMESIDVVNAHGSKDGWNAALAARLMSIPVIRARHIGNPIRDNRIQQLIYRPTLCAKVMTTSESIRADMLARGIPAEHVVSIPTGIDVEHFANGKPCGFRQSLNIPEDVPLVGQIAVLRGSKGPDIFLAAAQEAIARGSKAWFVFIGEGHYRERLEKTIARMNTPRIKLAGYQLDIPGILAELDVATLTARSPEGVPQSLLQAFAARVPVIASNRGGISEVAIKDQTALVCDPGKPPEIAEAIERIISDAALRTRLCEQAYKLVDEKYRISHTLEAMAELYRSAASTYGRAAKL